MVDNYNETLRALCLFLVANAPAGAERDVVRLNHYIEEGTFPNYYHLEWRLPNASCQMYINVGKYGGERFEDADGSTWASYGIEAQVSWPSWGSDSVAVCQERLALMTEITRLAAEVERQFSRPITTLVETKADREARLKRLDEKAARDRVVRLIRANAKGMRVGQERRVEVPGGDPDLLPVGEVSFCDSDRKYTTHVTATRTFYMMRVA